MAMILAIAITAGMNAQSHKGKGQGQGPGNRPGMMHNAGGFARLDLSEDQQNQLKEYRLAQYNTMKPLRKQQEVLGLKKRHLMSEDQVDLKEVNKIIDQQTELSAKIQKLKAAHRVEARSVLTDEQLMIMDQHRMRAKARGGKGGQGAGRGAPRQRI